jgi:hypothetical protein
MTQRLRGADTLAADLAHALHLLQRLLRAQEARNQDEHPAAGLADTHPLEAPQAGEARAMSTTRTTSTTAVG